MKPIINSIFYVPFVLLIFCVGACAPTGGGGSPSPQKGVDGVVLEGTVSGGGGNGCDGKALEAYSKKITDLDEYKLFLRPLLRKMSEESADPLVTYMIWAAEEKAWYFAPCALDKLSSAQLGLTGDSDQLARHTEHGVQIYAIEDAKNVNRAKTYYQKKSKAKAALLLHEMVMGARLLMKKSAKEQCTVLAKKDAQMCSDPELMAVAESRSVDPDEADVMNSADHEAVRTMTSLLAQKDADLSTENLLAMRRRLGFHFPWDRAQSSLTPESLRDAFSRSRQMGDRFRVAGTATATYSNGGRSYIKPTEHPYFKDLPMTCGLSVYDGGSSTVQVSFVTSIAEGADHEKIVETLKRVDSESVGTVCEDHADRIYSPRVWNEETKRFDWYKCQSNSKRYSAFDYQAGFSGSSEKVNARGVIRNGILYDEVVSTRIESRPWLLLGKSRTFNAGVTRILVTRDQAPRIRSISFEPKQVLKRQASRHDDREPELLPVPGAPIVECTNESVKQ